MVPQRLPNTRSNRLRNEVYKAVSKKSHKKLKLLLQNKSFSHHVINSLDSAETPLDLAASIGDHVLVEILLQHGALAHYKKYHQVMSQSTLYKAIKSRNLKVVELLLMHGCDPNTVLDTCPESLARHRCVASYWDIVINDNNLPMFQLLLKYKGQTVSNDAWCKNMLNFACSKGSHKIIEYLLEQGLSTESANEDGRTCLFYAVISKQISIIHLLISRGANVKHKDSMNRNLLHIAAYCYTYCCDKMSNLAEVIKLFIDHGCDINATDVNGFTPIHVIFAYGNNEILTWLFLRQPEIDLSIPDNRGATVLHHIVAWGTQDILKNVLCRSNLDIHVRDKEGNTPMDYLNCRHLENLSLLLEFGLGDTKALRELYEHFSEDGDGIILKIMEQYKLKLNAADLSDEFNVEALLNQHSVFTEEERAEQLSMYSKEIKRMKETRLCGTISFYDFLHVKTKLTCINVAKQPRMREILLESKHDFVHYSNMLTNNYLNGIRVTPIESNAINSAEKNLNALFHNKLPSLAVCNIISYIKISDMVTLDAMKLRQNNTSKCKMILRKRVMRTRKRSKKQS